MTKIERDLGLRKEMLMYTFSSGGGGQLMLCCVIGGGILALMKIFGLVLLVAAVFFLGFCLMYVNYTKDSSRRKLIIEDIILEKITNHDLLENSYCKKLEKGAQLCKETVVKAIEITAKNGDDDNLSQIISDAFKMIYLQQMSAQQATELQRVVDLIKSHDYSRGEKGKDFVTRDKGIESAQESVDEAEKTIKEINAQLSALTIRITEVGITSKDSVSVIKCLKKTSSTLSRLQTNVEIRKAVTKDLTVFYNGSLNLG